MALPLSFREAGIWHEMGHIHYEHYLKNVSGDQAQLRSARISAVEQGHVIPEEAEADHFAAARIGKDAVIGFLKYLLDTRPTGGQLGWNDLGKRELRNRP